MINKGNMWRSTSCMRDCTKFLSFQCKMLLKSFNFLVLLNTAFGLAIWEETKQCPLTCTCQLEHLTEAPIYRFMQHKTNQEKRSVELNDVLYDDNLESELMQDRQIVRSAICMLQQNLSPLEFINSLPKNLETLTLIQGHDPTNKTIKFSYLERFENLLSLELIGSTSLNEKNGEFIIEIDVPLGTLNFLNLEGITIKNSKSQIQNFVNEMEKSEPTFEYVKKIDFNSHTLTMVQENINEEIIPYEKYKKQNNEEKIPLLTGFKNLHLLRINKCNVNNVHWTMFEGLGSLEHLILDNNNLRFIPPFTFYGTPNLKRLSLAHNSLLNIQLTDLAGLLELEYLDLSYNNFSQLSELSLPPFPKLKLADFGNNPITAIFPNTFEVMNTTDSLIIGSSEMNLSLMKNSFQGLNLLKALTLNNLNIYTLTRELLVGMPNLRELTLTGNITKIEFDTFLDLKTLRKLTLNRCSLQNLSMDAFIGLKKLEILDLSENYLEQLPPAIFDQLSSLKELYLEKNKFSSLPRNIFTNVHAKLIRLNENPWHCSCQMSDWKPMIVNRIKRKVLKSCQFENDKGTGCLEDNGFTIKYVFDVKVAPKCAEPRLYKNWNVFHAMRRLLKCTEYKPKLKKKIETHKIVNNMISNESQDNVSNDNALNSVPISKKALLKLKKFKKHVEIDNNI